MEERWLYLEKRKRKEIESFARVLTKEVGDFWDFSEFVKSEPARRGLQEYSLEECLKQNKKMVDTKLVIGQEFCGKPVIRLAFRQINIWADYIKEYSQQDYQLVNGIFQRVFNTSIQDYRPQDMIHQRERELAKDFNSQSLKNCIL